MSSVFYGVADLEITKQEPWYINKIGGCPVWINDDIPTSFQSCCDLCGKHQALVVQLYSPVDESENYRCLYVFSCVNESCWRKQSGWSVYRMQKSNQQLSKDERSSTTKFEKFETSWDSDDWGSDDEQTESKIDDEKVVNEVEVKLDEKLSEMSLNEAASKKFAHHVNLLSSDHTPPQFPSFYLNVDDEEAWKVAAGDESEHVKKLMEDYKNKEEQASSKDNGSGGGSSNEGYEKNHVEDKTLKDFTKSVRLCPNQIIRYSYYGLPLALSSADVVVSKGFLPPKCYNCGNKSVFEFQLMPALLPYLKEKNAGGEEVPTSIEYGSVVIFTCGSNCWINSNQEYEIQREHVVLLDEPDLKFFKKNN